MVTQFYKKYDLTYAENLPVVKEAISGEQHIIPQEAPFVITLKHLPQLSDPSSVFVDGFTEVSKDPQSDEFVVDYVNNSGVIEFNPTNAGQSVNISYNAVGTVVWAETYLDGREGINKIQDAINAVEIAVDDHSADTSNPHNVSVDQIDAVSRFGDVILGALKTQDIVVQSGYNILPEVALGSSLGTIDKPFSDVFVGPGSLYIDGIEVISSTETTLDISTSTDQHMAVSTSGLGTTRLASAKEVFIWSGQDINVQNLNNLSVLTGGQMEFSVDAGGQNILFETQSTLGQINFRSLNAVNFDSPSVTFTNHPTVGGNPVLTEQYVHPDTHPASMIVQSATRRFVSDAQVSVWDAKQDMLDYTPENIANKGKANGYASLDAMGKIPLVQLPEEARQQTYVVSGPVERLALTGVLMGDRCYETSTGDSYIYDGVEWQLITINPSDISISWEDVENKPDQAIRWPSWAEVTGKPATATRWPSWGEVTGKPSTFAPSSHTHDYLPLTGKAADSDRLDGLDSSDFQRKTYTDFYVDGNANTYYPVTITGFPGDQRYSQYVEISRAYSWEAPDTWNNATHKGGLNLLIGNLLSGWGGQSYYLDITLGMTYSTIVGDITVASPDTCVLVVWLRGGHARYRLITDNPNLVVTPYVGDYVNKPGTDYETIYSPMTTPASAFNYTGTTKRFITMDELYAGGGYRNPKSGHKVWHAGNDGSGSGLDADLLDGKHATSFANASHSHAWADIASGVPATATRWPSWSEVTSKPSTFTPSTHSHSWADVTGQPATATRWPAWSEVTGKPTTFTPSSHNHSSLSGLTQVSTGGGGLKVQTSYGYITVGPANTGWSHFATDRDAFHFNKTIAVTGDIRHGPSYNIRVPKIWVQSSQPTATAAGDLWIQT